MIINPSSLNAQLRDMLQESLARGQHPRLTVSSNSMAPLFWADDQVILEAVQLEQLHLGDIITIIDPRHNGLLTHRIWAIQGNTMLTRGDHALTFDERWPPEAILGRVIGRIHKQHSLSFQTGWGQWLNQYVAALARREYRWLTGSQEAPTGVEPMVTSAEIKSARTRVIHRLFFGWAIFVTTIINLATRIKPGETKI